MRRAATELMMSIGYNHYLVSRGAAFDRLMKRARIAAEDLVKALGRINEPQAKRQAAAFRRKHGLQWLTARRKAA